MQAPSVFAGGGDEISLHSLFLNYILYFTKERFLRKTQAAYRVLLNTQNKTCRVSFYLRNTRNVVWNHDIGGNVQNSHKEKFLNI